MSGYDLNIQQSQHRKYLHSAIVVAELKLRNIERHIFGAHFMERADHAAFEGRSVRRVGGA